MKKIAGVAVFIFTVMATTFPAHADGASADLPIKARVIRCVTDQERLLMCSSENLCCNLPLKETEVTDTSVPPTSTLENVRLAQNSSK